MIYASLKPIPAWRHSLVPRVYVLFALFTGGLLFCAIATLLGRTVSNMAAMAGIVAAVALGLVKWKYWRDIDVPLPPRAAMPSACRNARRRCSSARTPKRTTSRRKWASWWRASIRRCCAAPPSCCSRCCRSCSCCRRGCWRTPIRRRGTLLAALCALAGAFVERWLFFAEAKHLVTLYY
jgi:DMSO reductase anchor subunit